MQLWLNAFSHEILRPASNAYSFRTTSADWALIDDTELLFTVGSNVP